MARYYNSKNNKKRNNKNGNGHTKDMFLRDYHSNMMAHNRMEAEGSGMINEDYDAVANLPQKAMMKRYAPTDYMYYNLNDDIHGIDVQIDDDIRKETSKIGKKYPEKY